MLGFQLPALSYSVLSASHFTPTCADDQQSPLAMDFSNLKDQVSNLTLYDLKAGVRKVQNGQFVSRLVRDLLLQSHIALHVFL